MEYMYRQAMKDLASDWNELLADLEDIRDEAQDCLDENGDEAVRRDVRRMDEALRLLIKAVELLDEGEEDA
ncbi:MAG: hypothetical protein IJ662_11585 [Clostridia bacterium]|nr:hypothetical protein [Clostridia bacterium]